MSALRMRTSLAARTAARRAAPARRSAVVVRAEAEGPALTIEEQEAFRSTALVGTLACTAGAVATTLFGGDAAVPNLEVAMFGLMIGAFGAVGPNDDAMAARAAAPPAPAAAEAAHEEEHAGDTEADRSTALLGAIASAAGLLAVMGFAKGDAAVPNMAVATFGLMLGAFGAVGPTVEAPEAPAAEEAAAAAPAKAEAAHEEEHAAPITAADRQMALVGALASFAGLSAVMLFAKGEPAVPNMAIATFGVMVGAFGAVGPVEEAEA